MFQKQMKFYDIADLIESFPDAKWYIVISTRHNGKTYSTLKWCLEQLKNGHKFCIVRRWKSDLTGKTGEQYFGKLISNGVISQVTNGEWSSVYLYRNAFYFCNYDDETGERTHAREPFCYLFAVNTQESYKSTDYVGVDHMVFDEFLSSSFTYVPNEWKMLVSLIDTVKRISPYFKVFMLGNTLCRESVYYDQFGIDVKKIEAGTKRLYLYGGSDLQVAFEYASGEGIRSKEVDSMFAFDDPTINISQSDEFDLGIYPQLPAGYTIRPKDIQFTFFIDFSHELFQCECISDGKSMPFIYVHKKTTPLKDPDHDLIYSQTRDIRPNWRRDITHPVYPVEKKIKALFDDDAIIYTDNRVGDSINSYLNWCKTEA